MLLKGTTPSAKLAARCDTDIALATLAEDNWFGQTWHTISISGEPNFEYNLIYIFRKYPGGDSYDAGAQFAHAFLNPRLLYGTMKVGLGSNYSPYGSIVCPP